MKLRWALFLGLTTAACGRVGALTEAQLVGSWVFTSYLAVRETDQGSYQLLIADEQRHAEYALVLSVAFQRDGVCRVTRADPGGGTSEIAARYRKQTIDGQETLRLQLANDEVTMTIRAIAPGEPRTLTSFPRAVASVFSKCTCTTPSAPWRSGRPRLSAAARGLWRRYWRQGPRLG